MIFSKKYVFQILIFFIFGANLYSQDCPYPSAQKLLNGNKVSANICMDGSLFWDLNDALFLVPNDQPNPPASIFNSRLWIGAMDSLGNLIIAGDRKFVYDTRYSAGPIINNNEELEFACEDFVRLWEVYDFEIFNHISDYKNNGVVDSLIENIFGYPAHQNPFFESINGFQLPNIPGGLAPFFDKNNDGIYNPDKGEFPLPNGVDKNTIPAHLIWGVFNDVTSNDTTIEQNFLNIEIQLTAWAFNCDENEILNHSIFTSHKFTNRGDQTLDSLFIGFKKIPTLGCPVDNRIGCIPSLNSFYIYNSDSLDGNLGITCFLNNQLISSYGNNPPVQAVTFLNQEMSSFIYNEESCFSHIAQICPPTTPQEHYNYLNGHWRDGSPLTVGDFGYYPDNPITSFAYPDHPNDLTGWSVNDNFGKSPIANAYVNQLLPNEIFTLDMAYTFYQDEDLDNIETIDLVYDKTPILQEMYDSKFDLICKNSFSPNPPNDNLIHIFPNPTFGWLNIEMKEFPSSLSIFDVTGRKVLEKTNGLEKEIQLSIDYFPTGIYFLKIKIGAQDFVKKIIKL